MSKEQVVYLSRSYVLATDKQIEIAGTHELPFVKFDGGRGSFTVRGNSINNEVTEFYDPLLRTVDQYLVLKNKITCNFVMKKVNTSTTKVFLDMFKHFSKMQKWGKEIKINWVIEACDVIMYETGQDLKDLFNLDFNLVILDKLKRK